VELIYNFSILNTSQSNIKICDERNTVETIDKNKIATIEYRLKWDSTFASHTDCYYVPKVNLWRDIVSERMYNELLGKKSGDSIKFNSTIDNLKPPHDAKGEFEINQSQFDRHLLPSGVQDPHSGRFYPKEILKGIPHSVTSHRRSFRCVGVDNGRIGVDFNHPLAEHDVTLVLSVHDVRRKAGEIGGECFDWMEIITDGPGMQARWRGKPTDFFSNGSFLRDNESEDILFYQEPRLVTHIDDTALSTVKGIYGKFLKNGMKVLDLMSSWKSHIPEDLWLKSVIGLGLNKKEMENNNQLSGYMIHDLNKYPYLPFNDEEFDAVICSVSVEYMTNPLEVFSDVARILKPNGYFILTFSNRWFPPKAVNIWKELHDFERSGLVLEYFLQSGKYTNLETYSMRGLPRPQNDKYYMQIRTSDPVYAVCGNSISK
jgi:hypothetical protein